MKEISVRLISKSAELPDMRHSSFFHSTELFLIAEKTPGCNPYMAVAEDKDQKVVAHMLALVWCHSTMLPPWRYSHGRVYGEGEYADEADKEQIFSLMLNAVTRMFRQKLCLYTEFSDISSKMFGYRHFRKNGYFPIPWQEIHNSLHSMPPEKRVSEKVKARIETSRKYGVTTKPLSGEAELRSFYKLLHAYFLFKTRRNIPNKNMFRQLAQSQHSKTLATVYKGKIIGGCVCIFSDNNAYLWYIASKRKTYHHIHPNTATVWSAIEYAYTHHFDHIFFLDAGLPFRQNPMREFILSFGGKPVSKFRWFWIPIPRINKIVSWFYNDK